MGVSKYIFEDLLGKQKKRIKKKEGLIMGR